MAVKSALIVLTLAALAHCQRPSFAGSKPIGYPHVTAAADELGNRFGEVDGTTQRLPLEALGDRDLVNRLSKLPIDKQPFWFINWQALEAHRQNPQTYPQRPNPFAQPLNTNATGNTAGVSSNSASVSSVNVNSNSAGVLPDSSSVNSNSENNLGNRNGGDVPHVSSTSASSTSESVNAHNVQTSDADDLINRNKFFNSGNINSNSFVPDVNPVNSELGNRFGEVNSNANANYDANAGWKQVLYHQNPLKNKQYLSETKKSTQSGS